MRKYRKKRGIVIILLIVCLSLGYAFATSSLNFLGNASVKGQRFDVHFENISPVDGSVAPIRAATIDDATSISFEASLPEPGDYYSFTFDVVNAGTIDAMIGSIEMTELTAQQKKLLDYKILYSNDKQIKNEDVVKAGKSLKLKVKLLFKDNITSADLENVTLGKLDFQLNINFVQSTKEETNHVMKNLFNAAPSDLKTYYDKLSTVNLRTSINVPDGVTSWDMSEAEDGSVMVYVLPNAADSTKYDLYVEGDGGLAAPKDSSHLFAFNNDPTSDNYTELNGLELLSTSEVTNMYMMFKGSNATELNLTNFDTSNVLNMSYMFYYNDNLNVIDVSNFKTENVTDMSNMFCICNKISSLNLTNFNTKNVTNMSNMFLQCSSLTAIDLSSFDTSLVTDMSSMFSTCSKLTVLDLSGFDTSSVTNMYDMFSACVAVTDLYLNKASFDKVTNYDGMLSFFTANPNLAKTIYVKDTAAQTFINARLGSSASKVNVVIANA